MDANSPTLAQDGNPIPIQLDQGDFEGVRITVTSLQQDFQTVTGKAPVLINLVVGNKEVIIIGTSHHEPMARNHQEWSRKRKEYGAWNYATNQKVIENFFREGIECV